jgi:hypothetical protein
LEYYLCRNEAGSAELPRLRVRRAMVMLSLWGTAFLVVAALLSLPMPAGGFAMDIWIPMATAIVASSVLGRRFRRRERALADA